MEAILPLADWEAPEPKPIRLDGVENPVASVLISAAASWLTGSLDFLVPPRLAQTALVGSLVKVKVSGKERLGVITCRKDTTSWQKPLQSLQRVLTPWPLLDAKTLRLVESVSIHYGVGSAVLLRYVLPTRRAKVDSGFTGNMQVDLKASAPLPDDEDITWNQYAGGAEFFSELGAGRHPRAVVAALPRVEGSDNGWLPPRLQHDDLSARFLPVAQLVKTIWQNGEQSLLIFPTADEAGEAYLFLRKYFGQAAQQVVLYTSTVPVVQAYEAFLKARFGQAAVVVASRGGVFIPLAKPGLCYCWDNAAWSLNSDMYPNFSARQVLLHRTVQDGTALVFEHYSVSAADFQLVERGFARKLAPLRDALRRGTSRFQFQDYESQMWEGRTAGALIPSRALNIARRGLKLGPVLISVPPDGKFSVVSCLNCGKHATCSVCGGALRFSGSRLLCTRCAAVSATYVCPHCGATKLRGRLLESRTVIEDIGKLFPRVPVLVSKPGSSRLSRIDAESRLVIASPGAEPIPPGGYQAALILRAHMLASRTALWASQEVMRRFLSVAAMVAPGKIVFVTEPLGQLWEQGLTRWDPWSVAAKDLQERQIGHFAPAWRTALLQSSNLAPVLEYLTQVLPEAWVLGPVESIEHPGLQAAFISISLKSGEHLGKVLRVLSSKFSKASSQGGLLIEVDPADPGGQVA